MSSPPSCAVTPLPSWVTCSSQTSPKCQDVGGKHSLCALLLFFHFPHHLFFFFSQVLGPGIECCPQQPPKPHQSSMRCPPRKLPGGFSSEHRTLPVQVLKSGFRDASLRCLSPWATASDFSPARWLRFCCLSSSPFCLHR